MDRAEVSDSAELLQSGEQDARLLLAAAETDWQRPISQCPDWDAAGLVVHIGGILGWMAAIVASGDRVSRRELPAAPPDPDGRRNWYLTNLTRAIDVLGRADADAPTWTFSTTGDLRAGWWVRRLAIEVAIHRWDAQDAVGEDGGPMPAAINGTVAAHGITEHLVEFLPGLVTAGQAGARVNNGLAGTVHLHATDGDVEWVVDLDAGGTATVAHAKSDVAVRGTRSALLLWLTTRRPAGDLDVIGPIEQLTAWSALGR